MEENNILSIKEFDLVTPSGKNLLSQVSFDIPKGKISLLSAGNGVGKTQLLKEVLSLKSTKIHSILKCSDIGYLPQVETLKLKIPFMLRELCSTTTKYYNEALQRRSWNIASGGEKKRALLARTLTQEKELYILDEPLNHLDKRTQIIIRDEIFKICKSGKSILMTGHIDLGADSELINNVELEQWKC